MDTAYVYFMHAKYVNYYYVTSFCADSTVLITDWFLIAY